MFKLFLLLNLFYLVYAQPVSVSTSSIELQVPLTPLMAYDCSTDGHSIVVREASLDGIPVDGEIIFDYHLPEGVIWPDIKFRTNMGSLYITVPVMYPHFYSIKSIDEQGILV